MTVDEACALYWRNAASGRCPLQSYDIESVIRIDKASRHCWLPASGTIGEERELENAVLLRCPGLWKCMPRSTVSEFTQSYLCRVSGILVKSHVEPFKLIMGPVTGLEVQEGDWLGEIDVLLISQLPRDTIGSLRESAEAEMFDVGTGERMLREFLDYYAAW